MKSQTRIGAAREGLHRQVRVFIRALAHREGAVVAVPEEGRDLRVSALIFNFFGDGDGDGGPSAMSERAAVPVRLNPF